MPVSEETILVTKMDAARRQLRTALRLWFDDGDPVAIHTLLSAAHEILHKLYRLAGHNNLIFDSKFVEEGARKEWALRIKEPPNFFKHADRDPHATFEFITGSNDVMPMFLCHALHKLGEPFGPEEWAYVKWLGVHSPEFFNPGPDHPPVDVVEDILRMGKKVFFDLFESRWRQGEGPPGNPNWTIVGD